MNMLATMPRINIGIFNTTGLNIFEKKKIEESDKNIKLYIAGLNEPSKKVSNKVDMPETPEVLRIVGTAKSSFEKGRMWGRLMGGFSATCHVLAFLSGRESSYGDGWDLDRRLTANMLCDTFRVSRIYKGLENYDLEMKDFIPEASSTRPIVTRSTISDALKFFPVPDLDVDRIIFGDPQITDKSEEVVVEEVHQDETIIIDTDGTEFRIPNEKKEEKVVEAVVDETGHAKPVDPAEKEAPVEESGAEKPDAKPVVETGNPVKPPVIKFDNEKLGMVTSDILQNKPGQSTAPALTKEQQKEFDSFFGEYLKDKSYQLNRINGAIECVINYGNGAFANFWFDPKMGVGDAWYLLGNIVSNNGNSIDTIPVHQNEKEIISKILGDKQYILTPEEVQKAISHLFLNQRIYYVFDMSNMGKHLKGMKKADFDMLGKKLTCVMKAIEGIDPNMLGRIRFMKFHSIDNFELVSDEKCKCPFPGQMCEKFTGVKVSLSNDTFVVYFNGNSQSFTISKDGVM